MTETRKIFYIKQEVGTEVTDAELSNLSADALIGAIHNSKLQPCRVGNGKLVLIDMMEDAWYFDDEYPATKIYAKEDFSNDYSLCGTVVEDDEFNSLSDDELRKAVTCSHGETYFFRNSDGDLMIQSTDESDTELTEDEIKALLLTRYVKQSSITQIMMFIVIPRKKSQLYISDMHIGAWNTGPMATLSGGISTSQRCAQYLLRHRTELNDRR